MSPTVKIDSNGDFNCFLSSIFLFHVLKAHVALVHISSGQDQIPASFIKIASEILDEPLTKIFNRSIADKKFCEEAKIAVVPPIFKKDVRTRKENYRPVSILVTFAKIFEKQLKNMI